MNSDRKQEVLRLHGYRCVYCGEVFEAADLTVDHVQPRMRGGDHSMGNLVACCRACNAAKGGAAAWRFLATRPALRANFLRHARWIWPRLRRAVVEAGRVVEGGAGDEGSATVGDGESDMVEDGERVVAEESGTD